MKWKASVSLESDTQPVKTHRTTISALRPQTAAVRAIREALWAFKGAHFRSLVVVLEKQAEATKVPASREEDVLLPF